MLRREWMMDSERLGKMRAALVSLVLMGGFSV